MTAYEPRDLSPRRIAWLAGGLFAAILVSAGIVAGLFALFPQPHPVRGVATSRPGPDLGQPRLEVKEGSGRAAIDQAARAHLQGYGWIDRAAGRAHIPIDRAMQVLVAHGWPDQDKQEPAGQKPEGKTP